MILTLQYLLHPLSRIPRSTPSYYSASYQFTARERSMHTRSVPLAIVYLIAIATYVGINQIMSQSPDKHHPACWHHPEGIPASGNQLQGKGLLCGATYFQPLGLTETPKTEMKPYRPGTTQRVFQVLEKEPGVAASNT